MNTAFVELDRAAARAAVGAATERFTALLHKIDDIGRPATGNGWTVAETAAHVAVVLIGFNAAITAMPIGLTADQYIDGDFPTRLAASNAKTLELIDHTDVAATAALITVEAQRFLRLSEAADPDQLCETPWYGAGRTRSVDCLTALALGELTVHGYDIGVGTGQRWPISAEHSTLILGTVCPHMWPLVVRPDAAHDASVTYEVRLGRGGPRYVLTVADGTAQVEEAVGPVDCVLSVDPVTFLLTSYGRMSYRRALMSGGIVLSGRRPWLGLRFKDLFFNP